MPLLLAILPAIQGFFSGVTKMIGIAIGFLKTYFPKILKWGFYIFIINTVLNIFNFGIYHIYYGLAYGVSFYVNIYTLNIIHGAVTGMVLFSIYKFLYS